MPHVVLEYSGNVQEIANASGLFRELHSVLSEVGGFRLQDFKSRAVRIENYFIGDGSHEQAFVNLDIRTFGGKSDLAKKRISQEALKILCRHFDKTLEASSCDISVQITELDRKSFSRTRSDRTASK